MSAVQAPAPPVQATLAGVEPVAAEVDALEVRWAMVGKLQKAAELRVSPDGAHGHLVLRLHQPAHGQRRRAPIVAHLHSHGPDMLHALRQLGDSLPAGALVLLTCRGLDIEHEGTQTGRDTYLHAWRCDRAERVRPDDAAGLLANRHIDQQEHHA